MRRLVATVAFVVAVAGIATVAWLSVREEPVPIAFVPRETPALTDLLAYDEEQAEDLDERSRPRAEPPALHPEPGRRLRVGAAHGQLP